MDYTINVSSKDLSNKADALAKENVTLRNKISALETAEKNLSSMWQGDGNDAFHKAFASDIKQMRAYADNMDKFIKTLRDSATQYNEAEKKVVNVANERKYK